MFRVELDVDVEPDEHGIYDGRVIAQQMVHEAMLLMLPYADNDPGELASLMHALIYGATDMLGHGAAAESAMSWRIAFDDEVTGENPETAMRRHRDATRELTEALLERARIAGSWEPN